MNPGTSSNPAFEGNPLNSDSPEVWDRLLRSIGPASILVCIKKRMGPGLRSNYGPEDVYQETLLHVWRDRKRCEWRGIRSFRRWVISVAEHRLQDLAERGAAAKRGGGRPELRLDDGERELPPPVQSTTPSRVASHLEEAQLMGQALDSLPEALGEIIRLRLFEERSISEVAKILDLGESAVKHRFRKGVGLYQEKLVNLLQQSAMPRERPDNPA